MDKVIELAREAAAQNGDTLRDAPEKETVEFIHAFYTLARADLEAELLEQARIVGMGGERELKLMAENERLREALSQLEIYAEESNNACYGTVSANLVLDISREALGEK